MALSDLIWASTGGQNNNKIQFSVEHSSDMAGKDSFKFLAFKYKPKLVSYEHWKYNNWSNYWLHSAHKGI